MATIPVTRLPNTSIAAMKCPTGTKMHILDLGTLQVDEPWILRGANASALSNKNPENKRRDLIVLSALIEYPGVGLILFETGCTQNIDVERGAPLTDIFPRTEYSECQKLPAAIEATGNHISDIGSRDLTPLVNSFRVLG